MNHDIGFFILIAVIIISLTQSFRIATLRQSVRRLEATVDAIIKHQGIEWPTRLSPAVQSLAQDQKIAAIQLHREQNPGLGLAEAKKDVEDYLAGK